MKSQRVGQRSGFSSSAGVHNYAGRFVEDDQVVVFIDHVDGNVFGEERRCGQGRQFRFDFIGRSQFVGSFCCAPIDQHVTIVNQALKTRAAPAFNARSEERIESRSRVCFGDGEYDGGLRFRVQTLAGWTTVCTV